MLAPGTDVPSLHELVALQREQLEQAGEKAGASDLHALVKLERQLEAREQLKRLNATTRQGK